MNWFAREMELKAECFEEGRQEGIQIEGDRYSAMVKILLDVNRMDDLLHASEDDAYRAQVYNELGLES